MRRLKPAFSLRRDSDGDEGTATASGLHTPGDRVGFVQVFNLRAGPSCLLEQGCWLPHLFPFFPDFLTEGAWFPVILAGKERLGWWDAQGFLLEKTQLLRPVPFIFSVLGCF